VSFGEDEARCVANDPGKAGADYGPHYSETGLRAKLARYAKAAGKHVIERVLWLFYAAKDPKMPLGTKAAIYSALGYFILPIDALPDVLPVLGYTDDMGVLAGALALCAAYVTPQVKARAREKLKALLGS
jgi:uncharacterized membrane protein YkvA (DUF1232 family)